MLLPAQIEEVESHICMIYVQALEKFEFAVAVRTLAARAGGSKQVP